MVLVIHRKINSVITGRSFWLQNIKSTYLRKRIGSNSFFIKGLAWKKLKRRASDYQGSISFNNCLLPLKLEEWILEPYQIIFGKRKICYSLYHHIGSPIWSMGMFVSIENFKTHLQVLQEKNILFSLYQGLKNNISANCIYKFRRRIFK